MFGQCTEAGCRKMLSEVFNLDNDITIGELKQYLSARAIEANVKESAEKKEILENTLNKIYRIEFSPDHIVLIKIDEVEISTKNGWIEPLIFGEEIVQYKGQLSYKELKGNFDNYVPNNQCSEITLEDFNNRKEILLKLKL